MNDLPPVLILYNRPGAALDVAVAKLHAQFSQPVLVEHYVGTREVQVALCERAGVPEVLDDALTRAELSGYVSITACERGVPVGWICYGPTACTLGTWDIYWIVVASAHHSRGIGSRLLDHAEQDIRARGGRMIVIETSGDPRYDATRAFYTKHGYGEVACIPDFYAPGDDKVVYLKT